MKRRIEDDNLRRAFCKAANVYGQEVLPAYRRPRHVTVLLNPAAGDNKSKTLFEKNVAPLLHLAGLDLHIVKTEFEGQARGYMDVIEKGSTDAVVLVGGSGLVVEAVTGFLRREDSEDVAANIPIGIIPTGKHTTLLRALLRPVLDRPPSLGDVKFMGEAAMAILRGSVTKVDVLKIERNESEGQTTEDKKTIYAVAGLEWGMHRDVEEIHDKYWYWGKRLKRKVAYFFSTMTFQPWPKTVAADIKYVDACEGCSKCFVKESDKRLSQTSAILDNRSLFQKLFTSTASTLKPSLTEEEEEEDRSHVVNEKCGDVKEMSVEASQIIAVLNSVAGEQRGASDRHNSTPTPPRSISLYSSAPATSRLDFIRDGWRRLKRKPLTGFDPPGGAVHHVREFQFKPTEASENTTDFFDVDNEPFEMMPISVSLLPKKIRLFSAL